MSAVPETGATLPRISTYTVGWSKAKASISLPWAYPPSAACEESGSAVKDWPSISVLEMLTNRFEVDTWFQAVSFPMRERWPRMAKASLLEEERDESGGLAYVVIDLDRPDHSTSPWETVEDAERAVEETVDRLGCSVYATRGGLRALWQLDRMVPLHLAQSYLDWFHAGLPDDLPVCVDRGVKDWTRGYRVPWCPRADGKRAPWGDGRPPMNLHALRSGVLLSWTETDLRNERTHRVVPVDWSFERTSDRNSKRVSGWFKPQLEELQNASSRHAVLIAKARALGGLCRGANELARYPGAVDPEPFLRMLIEATDTTNAERTARQALDFGAAEPWWFEDEPDNEPERPTKTAAKAPSTTPPTTPASSNRPRLSVVPREVPIEPRPGVTLSADEPDPLVMGYLVTRVNAKTEAITVLPTLPNAMIILDNDRRWLGRIRYNAFADRIEVDGKPISDSREAEIVLWMTRAYGATPSTASVHEAVNAIAHRHPYHPVKDYLDGLEWDGVNRLDTWLTTYAGVDDDGEQALVKAYGAKWMISICARVYQPDGGVKVDTALIFGGPKGLGKSTTFKVIGGPWFGDSALSIGDKDGYQVLSGKLVWELAELESVTRRELGTVKAFMTSQLDTYRPSYGRNAIERPRMCVFCGTVNSDSEPTFLRESDRRWWIVRAVRKANVAALAAIRDQLFAEAKSRYEANESWWLEDELEAEQNESVSAYVLQDPWVAMIEGWASGRTSDFTVAQVLEHALSLEVIKCTKGDEMRVGSVLAKLGYERRRKRVAKVKGYWWAKRPEPTKEQS